VCGRGERWNISKGKEENQQASMNRARKVAFFFFRDGQSLLLVSIHLASWVPPLPPTNDDQTPDLKLATISKPTLGAATATTRGGGEGTADKREEDGRKGRVERRTRRKMKRRNPRLRRHLVNRRPVRSAGVSMSFLGSSPPPPSPRLFLASFGNKWRASPYPLPSPTTPTCVWATAVFVQPRLFVLTLHIGVYGSPHSFITPRHVLM